MIRTQIRPCMMALTFCLSAVLFCSSLATTIVYAKAPIDVSAIGSVADFTSEISSKIELLEKKLASDAKFEDLEDEVAQAGGVIACFAQAIAEFPKKKDDNCKVHGPTIRDMAIALQKAKSKDDANKLVLSLKSALEGKGDDQKHADDYDWSKLTGMHGMMEEINARNSKLRRAARRPKGTQAQRLHAVTIALLTIAMHEDTHEVKDKTKVAEWQKMCVDYHTSTVELAKALDAKDKKNAQAIYAKSNAVCTKCHEAFRD